jgi:hypothetical protein
MIFDWSMDTNGDAVDARTHIADCSRSAEGTLD